VTLPSTPLKESTKGGFGLVKKAAKVEAKVAKEIKKAIGRNLLGRGKDG
jgi:hypothetical protein